MLWLCFTAAMVKFMLVSIVMLVLCDHGYSNSYVIVKPEPVTTAKLLERSETYTNDYPKDPDGFTTNGRIHATALKFKASYLNSRWSTLYRKNNPPFVNSSEPEFEPMEAEAMIQIQMRRNLRNMPPGADLAFRLEIAEEIARLEKEGWKEPIMTPMEQIQHYKSALAAFEKAASMPPKGFPDHQASNLLHIAQLQELTLDPERRKPWKGYQNAPESVPIEVIAGLLERSFEMSVKLDLRNFPGIAWDSPPDGLVSYQAAEGYLRLLPQGPRAVDMTTYLKKLREVRVEAKKSASSLPKSPRQPSPLPE